jgi:hypothetical protein
MRGSLRERRDFKTIEDVVDGSVLQVISRNDGMLHLFVLFTAVYRTSGIPVVFG